MFLAIKSSLLKMVRSLPKIWICYVNGAAHCWIPKIGYAHRLKNRAPPPNEADVEARREWYFTECEILFDKEFVRFADSEMALSKLNYGPEWYYNSEATETDHLSYGSNHLIRMCPGDNSHSSSEPDLATNELKEQSTLSEATLPVYHLCTGDNSQLTPIDTIIDINISNNVPSTLPEATLSSGDNSHSSSEPDLATNDLKEQSTLSEALSELEQYKENKRLCQLHNFNHPIHYKKFNKLIYTYVKTINLNDLRPGNQFLTPEELTSMPRSLKNIPFCRPGPLKRGEFYDWFLADSIVQEVYFKTHSYPYYLVRWLGYEDEYNTVEPLAHVKDTSVYTLFTNPKLYTACRAKNGCTLRRSTRKVLQDVRQTVELQMDIDESKYERAINKLIYELRIEEEAGRYLPSIGFCSYESSIRAWKTQHDFVKDKFLPMINNLDSAVYVDNHYIGQIFGNLHRVAEFRELSSLGVKKESSLGSYIDRGLSKNSGASPRYVSFFVPRKFDTDEKKNKAHLNLHMCVFTVRSSGGAKDAIYYDPSPKNSYLGLPEVLDELKKPVLKSFTKKFGVASEKDDCTFQSMCYIIGIATEEVPFEPDLSQPCRKLDKFVAERASKKMKTEK